LLLRVITHGVILLGIAAVGFLTVMLLVVGGTMERDMKTFSDWFGGEACRRSADAATRAQVRSFPAAVAVYTNTGQLVESSESYQTPSLSQDDLSRVRSGEPVHVESGRLTAIACPEDAARYAVVAGPPPALPVGRLAPLIALVILLVAVGSIPLARSIVKPLHDLNEAAKSLGRGNLRARASVTRDDEIGELADSFNAMAANLEGHLRIEKELLANVSHELRTPLARVRVVLETALDDPSRAALLVKEISRDLGELERLTDDVLVAIRLDFAADQEGAGLSLQLAPIDLAATVRGSIARFAEAHPDREISLDAADVNVAVMADQSILARLFANLLDNARKYSSEAIHVRVLCDHVGEATVVIEDRGIGIDAEDLDRVFDPFFRSTRGRASGVSGTGLGLTLSRRIVQAHEGRIGIESTPGAGTKVTTTFRAV
jgi:signal transduction histidine kinase